MKKTLFLVLICSLSLFSFGQNSFLNRQNDPVVILGSDLPTFSALRPSLIVGFKYLNGSWAQIPIQIDERALLDIVRPYGPLAGTSGGSGYLPPGASDSNPKIVFYCDSNTHIGKDPVIGFDADDELVFMAKDAGQIFAGTLYPSGVIASSCKQIKITDPLNNQIGYIYLFENQGTLLQNAGFNYLNYSSNLASTAGFPANNNGTNNENTLISSVKYSWHFSSEWVSDELKIGIANNTDILDRHKSFFANGTFGCFRNESVFSSGENAFIALKTGPIRIIRAYMGAQSGPLTQRTHLFYEGRHDIITALRVHAIPSIYDAFDYEPAASGMIYRNNLNPSGVLINGISDPIVAGMPTWEQVSGTPGSLSVLNRMTTNLTSTDANIVGYYDDNSLNPASNCTGTNGAWGSSGLGIIFNNSICTDCYSDTSFFRNIEVQKIVYIDSANFPIAKTIAYNTQFNAPFQVNITVCQPTNIALDNRSNNLAQYGLYPNPTKGIIKISGLNEIEPYSIIIFDVYGKERLHVFNNTLLDIFTFKQGVYFALIRQGNISSYLKIIKQ